MKEKCFKNVTERCRYMAQVAKSEVMRNSFTAAADEIERLRQAVQRALDDEESGTGWGPDVTVCGYLREALLPPT